MKLILSSYHVKFENLKKCGFWKLICNLIYIINAKHLKIRYSDLRTGELFFIVRILNVSYVIMIMPPARIVGEQ